MAAVVGDAIVAGRQMIPDMPQTLQPPGIISLTPINVAGGILTPGPLFIVLTAINQWGETVASAESNVTIAAGQNAVQVSFFGPPGNSNTYRLYYGQGAGGENGWVPFTSSTGAFTFSTPLPSNGGTPPTINRAFLPDTDGGLVGAYAVFQWLNDGLKIISRETGGLLDYCGIPSAINQPLFIIPGEWNEITSLWYDGYWLVGANRADFFRRNNISSQILSSFTLSVINNQNVLEIYPQPARTAAVTTLSAAMAATDLQAQLTSVAGFVLPFGFAQIDSEIMAYGAIQGSRLTGIIRGLGGSGSVAHNPGAPVNELNIFWSGKRQLSPAYAPGSSLSTLPIPTGWEVLLAQYIGGRAKVIEHDFQALDALEKSLRTSIKQWASMIKPVATRRQVGGSPSPAVLYPDISGGIILPSIILPILYGFSLYSNSNSVHSIVHGGIPWTFTFMCFATLGIKTLNMWGKQKIQRHAGNIIHVLRNSVVVASRKLNGPWNFARSALSLFLKLSRNAQAKHGNGENGIGLHATDSRISSTSDPMRYRGISMFVAKKREKNCVGQQRDNLKTKNLGSATSKP